MEALSKIYVRPSSTKLAPLSAVTRERQGVAALSVNYIGQRPAVNIQFNAKPGISVSSITASFTYQDTASAVQKSVGGLAILPGVASVVIYLVSGMLYESFIHPVTILSGLPFAG